MKVKFVPQNVEFEIKPGQSVLHVAQDNGLYVKSVCKGVPSCAECRVRVIDGEFNVLPPGTEELSLIGTGHFIDHRRLSCQLKCFGDITVDMTEQTQKQAGLIGGRKTKQKAIKDDRVEDAVTIRLNDETKPRGDRGAEPARASSQTGPRPARVAGVGAPVAASSGASAAAASSAGPRPVGGARSVKGPAPVRPPQPNNDVKEQRSPDPTAPGYSDIDSASASSSASTSANSPDGERPAKRRRRRGGRGHRNEGGGADAGPASAPAPKSGPPPGPPTMGPRPKGPPSSST